MALPKGRILKELIPLLEKAKIIPEEEFFNPNSRKLLFTTNQKKLSIIKVRSFDVATFVAFGAAQIGVAGDDVINEQPVAQQPQNPAPEIAAQAQEQTVDVINTQPQAIAETGGALDPEITTPFSEMTTLTARQEGQGARNQQLAELMGIV